MPMRYPGLPPAATLIALECVVRHSSFAAAARELGVSQSAISQQVKALELELAAALVLRHRPRITPTAEGQHLADAVRVGLDHVVGAVERVRHPRRPGVLTVAATTAFSSLWLMPRLPDFHAGHPDVEVHLHTSDWEIEPERSDFDVGVVFTGARWANHQQTTLFADEVVPVCHTDYLARQALDGGDLDLGAQVLLHHDFSNPSWMGWPQWCAACGLATTHGAGSRHFSNYLLLLQAAREGHGVALGWRRLVQPMLDRGELAQMLDLAVVPEARYHVVTPGQRTPHDAAHAFRGWLMETAAADW